MNFYEVFYYCTRGRHKVTIGTEAKAKNGRCLCPEHRWPVRTRTSRYGELRDRVYKRKAVA